MSTRIALFVVDLLEGGASFVLDIRARIMLRWCWDAYHHRNRGRTWMEAHRKHFPLEGNAHCYWCQQLGWDQPVVITVQDDRDYELEWRQDWAMDHYPSGSCELGHEEYVQACPFCQEEADARFEEDHRCSHSAENFFPDCEWCQEEANAYWDRVGGDEDEVWAGVVKHLSKWEEAHASHMRNSYIDTECPHCVGTEAAEYWQHRVATVMEEEARMRTAHEQHETVDPDCHFCYWEVQEQSVAAARERDIFNELHYELHSEESPFLACSVCQDEGWVK